MARGTESTRGAACSWGGCRQAPCNTSGPAEGDLPWPSAPGPSGSSVPPIYRHFAPEGEELPVLTQQQGGPGASHANLSNPPPAHLLPMGCAQGLLQQDRGWAAFRAALPKAEHEGPTRPQALNAQPKGQFNLAKGTSVSLAGQIQA